MKYRLLMLALAGLLIASCGSPRNTTLSSSSNNAAYGAPLAVGSRFSQQFPGATNIRWSAFDATQTPIDWELNGWPNLTPNDYMVTFDQYGKRYHAWYDGSGNWIGSTCLVADISTLPKQITEMLQRQYDGYTIESAQHESWKGNNNAYEIKLRSFDSFLKLLVDENGVVLRRKANE